MSKKNKLLLVTYYWPPSGNVGVFRWLYFTKYLAKLGWEITVFHPKNEKYQIIDHQLNKEIPSDINQISTPMISPVSFLNTFSKKKNSNTGNEAFSKSTGFLNRLKLYVRANFFIPDAKMLWIKPSVKTLKKFLKEHPQQILITNGPPHSCHVIGLKLKKQFPALKWVADFRDPWLEIDYFQDLPLKKSALKKHQQLERNILQNADLIITVSPSWKGLFQSKGAKHVQTLTNGFFENKFPDKSQFSKNQRFTLRHVGTIDEGRNPQNLWPALEENGEIQTELIGNISSSTKEEIQYAKNIEIIEQLSHEEAIRKMVASDALLLLNNKSGASKGRIPAKLFEYIGARKPILYLGELDNDACDLIKKHQLGICLHLNASKKEISDALVQIRSYVLKPQDINEFSRANISEKLDELLKSIL